MVAHLERALRKGTRLSLRSPGTSLGTQDAALGEEKQPFGSLSETVTKQESLPWQEQRACGRQVSPAPCGEGQKPGC